MTHEDIKILISAYIDGEVTPSEKTIVEEHLSTCTSCQKDYKQYMSMSSSLSKWSNETLSPDEEIKIQKGFEKRREPMFTKRTLMTLGTTLALTIIIGSTVQMQIKKGQVQARLKSAVSDMGDQYSSGNTAVFQTRMNKAYLAQPAMEANKDTQYEPYYANSNYPVAAAGKMALGREMAMRRGAEQSAYSTDAMVQEQNLASPVVRSYITTPGYAKAPISYARKVITSAGLTLVVEDAGKTQFTLGDIIRRFNGVIVNSQTNKSYDGTTSGTVVFKVLPKDLGQVLVELRKLGDVQWESQTGEDVTEQYVDSQARLENYKVVRDRLHKTLDENAHKVDDILEVEREIARVEGEIDALKGAIKLYETQSAMSTVTVSFTEKAKNILKGAEPENKWVLTLKQSYEAFINNFTGIIVLVSSCLPVVIWLLLFWGIFLLVRKFFKK